MPHERWFPLKHRLPDGTSLGVLLCAGQDWQIFRVDRENRVLVVRPSLAERWIASGLLPDTVLRPVSFGEEIFRSLLSGANQRLEPVGAAEPSKSKADGLSFASSLRETRKIERETSLHDAIFVERYSRLLPTWSLSQRVADENVLGQWLTGGVPVPATASRRLLSLVRGLSQNDLRDLIDVSGLANPDAQEPAPRSSRPEGRRRPRAPLLSTPPAPSGRTSASQPNAARRFRLTGRPALEAFFNDHVVDIVENPERYKALGIDFPTAIVLHGPPGCGKTFAVERLGEFLDWPIFHIDSNSVGSPFIHETSRKVGEIFDKAIDAGPSMVVIDEMESYLSDRQLHASAGLHHVEEVAEFLRRIPEANKRRVLIVGMTNRLDMIDAAILRRGRFDHVIEVGMPSAEEVTELVQTLLRQLPLDGAIDAQEAVRTLSGRPLSDAAFVVREAARLAAKAGRAALDQGSLSAALRSLPPSEPDKRRIGF